MKPLYVVHTNGNGRFKACPLDSAQAARARRKVAFGSRDIRKLLRMGSPFVLFSGGKDSLCLLHYMKEIGEKTGTKITALHANTTAGFPEVERYVKRVCRELDVPLVVVKPLHDFFEIAKRWGIPGVKSRWCCETLKIAPLRRHLTKVEGSKVVYDGIRAAESRVRATYNPVWYHPSFRCISASPIFSWPNAKVDRYIERHKLPTSPAVKLGTSAECWCGAYKCRADFQALLEIHPEIFDKLVEVEDAQRGKYTFLYEDGKRTRLRSLKKKRKKASSK